VAKGFHLEIVTPEQVRYDDQVDGVVVPGVKGELGLLADHAAILALTDAGIARVKVGGREVALAVGPGFVTMQANKAVYLAEFAEKADEVNVAAARSGLDAATRGLQAATTPQARERARLEVKSWQVRLDVAGRKG
jgi:F-type H+-transporting ATPase subunit epsilon